MGHCFAVMDVKCHEVTAVLAEWGKNDDYALKGFCRTGSKGFQRGMVVDEALATDSIARTLAKLKERTGKRIHEVYAGVSSTSVSITPSSGAVLLSRYGREVSLQDIKKCVEISSTIKVPLEKEALHRIIRGFSIDGERQVKSPLNLEGVKLEAFVNVLTISSSIVRNMAKCISQAGFIPGGFVFSGLASALRVLAEDERQKGTALLDISRDLTEVMLFRDGLLTECKVFPVGESDIHLEGSGIDRKELEKLAHQIVSLAAWPKINKIVLIGRAALMEEMVEKLENIFKIPTTVGSCVAKPFEDLPAARSGYIASLGILDWLQEEKNRKRREGNIIKRGFNRTLAFIDRYF